ncbi:MAG: HD domain-containing protein [Cytophagales bacterium]|nr:HD domain-containing protein [Bernardetiaceae bacterium]MDW8204284.1 HD domain-containing protein [Cytophagales bacterium]
MWHSDDFLKALALAGEAHASQKIPGLERPYLEHVIGVTMEALRAALTDESLNYNLIICCGLLHDVVEDTSVSLTTIEEQFGTQVAQGVAALTKNGALPKEKRMEDSLARILALGLPEIRIIKMADRCDNLRKPPPHWTREKILAYYNEAHYILNTLRGVNRAIEDRLEERIQQYEQYCRN